MLKSTRGFIVFAIRSLRNKVSIWHHAVYPMLFLPFEEIMLNFFVARLIRPGIERDAIELPNNLMRGETIVWQFSHF